MFPEVTRDDIFRLETKRLWLRWPRAADAESIVRFAGDPEVALKTAAIPYPYTRSHAESFILEARNGNAQGKQLILALTLKSQPHEAIGVISAHGAPERGTTTLGFWLGRPFWGQGLMGEAAAAFVDLLFTVTGVQQIDASALQANEASLHIQKKLGFVSLGVGSVDAPARGGELTVERMRLLRGENRTLFATRRPKLTSA